MTKALEMREGLRAFYGKYEIYIKPAIRFLLALAAFSAINGSLGYMKKLDHPAVVLLLALLCAFLPVNVISIIGIGMILLHLSVLSLEVCVIALLLFLLMFFMYFKFAPENGYNGVLTPLLFYLKIPQVMPVSLGLLKGPDSGISMICGIITFYFLQGIRSNEALFRVADEEGEATAKFTLVLQQIIGNKELYLTIAAFTLTALIVYLIRRLSMDHAWTIAISVGNTLNFIILLAGNFLLGKAENMIWLVIGISVSLAVTFLLEFFLYNLDYSRVERVQFEDDEYYYYVKAIPKVYVSAKQKKVKQINSKRKTTINKKALAEEFDIDQDLLDD